MGFRYRKSINLGGGVRLNAGKNGVGVSAGVKGLRVSKGADGKTRVTASVPGTGLSYQETISSKKDNQHDSIESQSMFEDTPLKFEMEAFMHRITEWGENQPDDIVLRRRVMLTLYNDGYTIKCIGGEFEGRGEEGFELLENMEITKKVLEGKWLFLFPYRDVMMSIYMKERDKLFEFKIDDESKFNQLIEWQKLLIKKSV